MYFKKTTTLTKLTTNGIFVETLSEEHQQDFHISYFEKYCSKAMSFQFTEISPTQTVIESVWENKEIYENISKEWEDYQYSTYGTSMDRYYRDTSKFLLEIKFEEVLIPNKIGQT